MEQAVHLARHDKHGRVCLLGEMMREDQYLSSHTFISIHPCTPPSSHAHMKKKRTATSLLLCYEGVGWSWKERERGRGCLKIVLIGGVELGLWSPSLCWLMVIHTPSFCNTSKTYHCIMFLIFLFYDVNRAMAALHEVYHDVNKYRYML